VRGRRYRFKNGKAGFEEEGDNAFSLIESHTAQEVRERKTPLTL
jgi:hypothetical protein